MNVSPGGSRISGMILNLDRSVNSLNYYVSSRLGLGLILHRSAPRITCNIANQAVMFTGISTLSNSSSNSCNILCSNSTSYRPVILRAITRQRIPRCVRPIL